MAGARAKTAKTRAAKAKTAKPKPPAPRMTLAETMAALEKAGTAQARKTYARHGATEPMFGVSFAFLKTMVKRIGVDHDLALALWDTGNFDACNLAMKILDPSRMTPADLDRWAGGKTARMCRDYVAMAACESGHGPLLADRWLASPGESVRSAGWSLVGQLAMRDAALPDSWFAPRVEAVARSIHAAPNGERDVMNRTLIQIGGRSPALRKAALAAAKRIGPVEVDHGDTSCKTPEAAAYIEKMWAHAKAKGFDSPSAQERERESPRTRC